MYARLILMYDFDKRDKFIKYVVICFHAKSQTPFFSISMKDKNLWHETENVTK